MRRDVHADLIAWLVERGGGDCRVLASSREAWASATFSGERHHVELTAAADGADRLTDGIEEAEALLRGHLLADIAIVARTDGRMAIEALTIES